MDCFFFADTDTSIAVAFALVSTAFVRTVTKVASTANETLIALAMSSAVRISVLLSFGAFYRLLTNAIPTTFHPLVISWNGKKPMRTASKPTASYNLLGQPSVSQASPLNPG